MPLADPSVERVSACPVHFLWDGRGVGRFYVRAGFLGFLAAGFFACLARMPHAAVPMSVALGLCAVSATAYVVGQALTIAVVLRS